MSPRASGGRHEGWRRSAESSRGYAERASSAMVESYLRGIAFPATKRELIERAQENRAPGDVMHVLDKLDEKEYRSVVDIAEEVGRFD